MSLLFFLLIFTIVIAGHFALAAQAWRRLRGVYSNEIDIHYTRRESYFADSFRSKITGWLRGDVLEEGPGFRVIDNGRGERVVAMQGEQNLERAGAEEIYAIAGNFKTQPGSVFHKEILVNGDARIGERTALQAVAVQGSLELGPQSKVLRWADSDDHMAIGPGAAIHARATSRTSIHLCAGARAKSLFAPVVTTDGYDARPFDPARVPAPRALRLPLVKGETLPGPRLQQMDEHTFFCDGDLHFKLPVDLNTKLIVRGDFSCPAQSRIAGDVKAGGDLRIGPGSLVEGNLVAGGMLELGFGSQFQGILHAGGDLVLEKGARGVAGDLAVAVYATGHLMVETDVMVQGKLAAGQWVHAVRPKR